MITAKTYRVIDIALKQSTKLHSIPFTWNSGQFKLEPAHLTARSLFWPVIVWAYVSFIFISTFINQEALAKNQMKNVMHMLFLILYSFMGVVAVNVMWNREHIASLFNQYFRFIQKLDAAGHVDQHSDISYLIIRSFLYISYSQGVCGLVMFFESARSTYYIYSLVPEAYGSWPLMAAFALFEYPFYICLWQYCIFTSIVLFPYLYGTLYWLREIIHQANRPKRLSPESTYAIYKCFQILAQEFNCCYAEIGLPSIQFYLILITVIANHILIRHAQELSLPAVSVVLLFSCVAFFIVFIMFPKAAAVNSLSSRFIKTMRAKAQAQSEAQEQAQAEAQVGKIQAANPAAAAAGPKLPIRQRGVNKKQVRACFPLKIRINSFAYIVRFTTLRIVGLIFYWTVRSVLLKRK